jgi:hypothetical protein
MTVDLLGINCSQMRNPPAEMLFHQELSAHGQGIRLRNVYGLGIYRRNLIPLEITSSYMRNPPKEGDFAGNFQLIDADSNW